MLKRDQILKNLEIEDLEPETFCFQFVRRYPNRLGLLERMKTALGELPDWNNLNAEGLRKVADSLEDLSSNSRQFYFAAIKSVIGENEERCKCKMVYKKILRAKKQPSQAIYLNDEEVSLLDELEPMNDAERYAKRIFLLGCYQGVRHSDAVRISPRNIQGDMLVYTPQKTTNLIVQVPIHSKARKYLVDEIKVEMRDCDLNDTIRNMCRRIGMNDELSLFRRGTIDSRQKYEFVSTHTARRSFATNLSARGIDISEISQMMGHTNITQTTRYIVGKKQYGVKTMDFFK